jgi:hypothetical protein
MARTKRVERAAHIDRDVSTMDVFEHVIRGVCLLHAWQSLHEAKTLDLNVEGSARNEDDGLVVWRNSPLREL